jgi:hypothetical protein
LVVVAGGEWLQMGLPDRTPESTDLFLLAGGAVLLAIVARVPERGRRESR